MGRNEGTLGNCLASTYSSCNKMRTPLTWPDHSKKLTAATRQIIVDEREWIDERERERDREQMGLLLLLCVLGDLISITQ